VRIAHVTPYFHPEFYGSHEAFLSRELARRGHQVVLFTSDRMPRWGGAAGIDQRLPRGRTEWEGVQVVRLRAGPTISFVPSFPGLSRALGREEFDLFLSHEVFSIAAWHALRAARRAARPFVLIQHGYSGGRRWLYRALFQLEFRLLGRRVLEAADVTVTLTGLGREFLVGLGADPARVEVIPTGVDTELFRPAERCERPGPVVGFLGRVDRDKGVLDLLEAFARARADVPEVRPTLRIAGKGDAVPLLRSRADALGLADEVTLPGRLPHAAVPGYLADLDVLAAPTRVSEPFGIVAVEAAAAGTATIASRLGGLAETVVDGVTGRLVEPGDVDGLTAALRQALADPSTNAAQGAAARERAERVYSWAGITDRFEELFGKLVAGPRQRRVA